MLSLGHNAWHWWYFKFLYLYALHSAAFGPLIYGARQNPAAVMMMTMASASKHLLLLPTRARPKNRSSCHHHQRSRLPPLATGAQLWSWALHLGPWLLHWSPLPNKANHKGMVRIQCISTLVQLVQIHSIWSQHWLGLMQKRPNSTGNTLELCNFNIRPLVKKICLCCGLKSGNKFKTCSSLNIKKCIGYSFFAYGN